MGDLRAAFLKILDKRNRIVKEHHYAISGHPVLMCPRLIADRLWRKETD